MPRLLRLSGHKFNVIKHSLAFRHTHTPSSSSCVWYLHIYITYLHARMCVCCMIDSCAYLYVCLYVYKNMRAHTHERTHALTPTHTHTQTHAHTNTLHACTHIRECQDAQEIILQLQRQLPHHNEEVKHLQQGIKYALFSPEIFQWSNQKKLFFFFG